MNLVVWRDALIESGNEVLRRVMTFAPNLLLALSLLLIGWGLAWVARAGVQRVARVVLRKAGKARLVAAALDKTRLEATVPALTGALVFWMVLVAFVTLAVERLELQVATELASRLTYLLPDLLVGLLIILGGVLVGNVAHGAIVRAAAAANLPQGRLIGRAAEITVILVAIATGAGHIGIESTLVTVIIGAAVGSVLGAAALAFGLGARQAVGNMITTHYLTRLYRVGQRVRVQGYEGRIVEFNQSGVILETDDGRVLLPGRVFQEEPSLAVRGEGE